MLRLTQAEIDWAVAGLHLCLCVISTSALKRFSAQFPNINQFNYAGLTKLFLSLYVWKQL